MDHFKNIPFVAKADRIQNAQTMEWFDSVGLCFNFSFVLHSRINIFVTTSVALCWYMIVKTFGRLQIDVRFNAFK